MKYGLFIYAVFLQGRNLKAVQGLKKLLDQLADILLYLSLPILGVVLAFAALQYIRAEDGMEKKAVKERFTGIIIGTAIACTAPSIASWIWSQF